MNADGDFYADPVVYDILHTPGTAREVDGLERMARLYGKPRRGRPTWLEPACGTGRYLRVAASRGLNVAGFDRSPAMVDYARGRLQRLGLQRRARLFEADMTAFATQLAPGSVDFAFNLINSIRHLQTDEDTLLHLRQMARVLRPDGVYVVGLSLAVYDEDAPSEDVWEGRRGQTAVRQVVQYLPPTRRNRREQVINHLVVERPSGETHHDSSFDLRSYSPRQWEALLAQSPFRREATVDEMGRPLPSLMAYGIDVLTLR